MLPLLKFPDSRSTPRASNKTTSKFCWGQISHYHTVLSRRRCG